MEPDVTVDGLEQSRRDGQPPTANPLSRLMFWRSPADQPAWCRPVLLGIAAIAGLAYGWRLNGDMLERYYAAAARSMAGSPHDFIYGAFDPRGLFTVDKLPGALWPQALSVWLFGVHVWAVVLPQVVEGVLTILVLYRAVRRLAGPAAGMLAATALAVSPVMVLLARGNVADTLLVLLLVLAADATAAAVHSGRLAWLVLAGVWVGLGFQAKMAQAWLVLPALAVPFLVAAPGSLRRRLLRLSAAGAVTAVVSLSWMLMVTLTPAADRPYIDGSLHNSVFEQVFVYNGGDRFDESTNQLAAAESAASQPGLAQQLAVLRPPASWHRLLGGTYGRDSSWLLPAAVVAAVGLLVTRRRSRGDPVRAAVLLWGSWLVTDFAVFSTAAIQPYYLAVLAPPVAALVGMGLVEAWHAGRIGTVVLGALVGATIGYQLWLLPSDGTGKPGWLGAALATAAVVAVAGTAIAAAAPRFGSLAMTLAIVSLLIAPAVAAGSVALEVLGPFDTPYQPDYATAYTRAGQAVPDDVRKTIPALKRTSQGASYLAATGGGRLAANIIFVSGEEVLPIGGFTGGLPSPTLDQLRALIAAGQLHVVMALSTDSDPRIAWISHHCRKVPHSDDTIREYYCVPADAGP